MPPLDKCFVHVKQKKQFHCLSFFAFETPFLGTSKNKTRRQEEDNDSRGRRREKKEDYFSLQGLIARKDLCSKTIRDSSFLSLSN